jgi:hypothetical protein
MNRVRYPPNSTQKLDPLRGFPQRILFKRYSPKAKFFAGLSLHWTFEACGCFGAKMTSPGDETTVFKCTAHGGDARCFYDRPLE